MFFKLHSEGKIGYKKLTDADLGLSTDSNQTHIGLFGDIFTFLSDRLVEDEAFLIYNDQINIVDCYFDRIERPNGTFRSPKIRKGDRNSVSVVTIIRDEVQKVPTQDWYLIWFGLQNEKMVFYFFHNLSKDYKELSRIIDLTRSRGKIENPSDLYNNLLNYLENKIEQNGRGLLEELEIASQTEISQKKYQKFDLDKANELFKQVGKQGEKLVANYLDFLKSKNQIFNYNWYNQDEESGLPYDFTIQDNHQNIIHIDVKSTSYQFEQPIIFSNQEVEFIRDIPNYNIYRVFDISNNDPKLKICDNGKNFAHQVLPHISDFSSKLSLNEIQLKSAKIAIRPINDLLPFNNKEIKLNF